jgi:hypothetical protein
VEEGAKVESSGLRNVCLCQVVFVLGGMDVTDDIPELQELELIAPKPTFFARLQG